MQSLRYFTLSVLAICFSLLLFQCTPAEKKEENTDQTTAEAQEVNVYSHRHYESDKKLFEQFEEQTGIKVNVVKASADELINKLEMEGETSPADILITVDAGRLYRAKDKSLLQPISSDVLMQNVPEHLRDTDNQWFGLTKRARVIVFDKEKVKPEMFPTYESLASSEAKEKLLIRSSENVYNQSLMASIIAHLGEEKAKNWAMGVVDNMAREPKGGDRDQVKAIAAGEGTIAVINTYYLAQMLNDTDEANRETAQKVGVIFPNQDNRGTHINVSGAGVTKNAPNKENAIKLIEFLTSKEAQETYVNAEYEYPVNASVEAAETLKEWGNFKEDSLSLSELGNYQQKAVLLFDEAGWK